VSPSRAWGRGSTRAWRVIRQRVLERDGYLCQIKLQGEWTSTRGEVRRCLIKADCVHHIGGKANTGDDPQYLQAACSPCNLKVGDVAQYDPPHRPMTRW